MDGDDDYMQDEVETESSQSDDDELPMEMENAESASIHDRHDDEEFQYEVLTADQIVQFMVDCIKEVNAVVQV